jgi:hypothetical protein
LPEEARLTRDLLAMLPRHVVTKSFEQAAGGGEALIVADVKRL